MNDNQIGFTELLSHIPNHIFMLSMEAQNALFPADNFSRAMVVFLVAVGFTKFDLYVVLSLWQYLKLN